MSDYSEMVGAFQERILLCVDNLHDDFLGRELLYVLIVHPEQVPSWPKNSKQHKLNWTELMKLKYETL